MEKRILYIIGIETLLVLGLLGGYIYTYRQLNEMTHKYSESEMSLNDTKAALAEREGRITEFEKHLEDARLKYSLSEENGSELFRLLTEEKDRNEEFEEQINDITGTVGKLDKLSRLDPELLMKYSKVYFLNEHYTPAKTDEIPKEFRFKKEEPEYIDSNVAPFLEDLLEDARDDGIGLLVVSGYRSYNEQRGLKNAYSVQYGTGANAFSADQGYSEHQLGTTIDFTTSEIGGGLTGFQNTEAYAWLTKYAHKYGFALSYPEKNGYYIFEPWHWRFVGEDLADDLHDDDKFFYDLDQREIDKYLISIFD